MSGGQPNRLAEGGLVQRDREIAFHFDGRRYHGHAGDTLASALIANGVRLVGRSFKYHRPRGVFTAGSEEPNALVELGRGAGRDPNSRATVTELHDGLVASSQNRFPSLGFDVLAFNDLLAPFLAAGFYYKTFMWPAAFWEKLYEPVIRRAAGLGALSGKADPDAYEKATAHCDVLIIGAGPAGLQAALTAARGGARVILADEDFVPGGRLNGERMEIARTPAHEWAAKAATELASMKNVRLLTRTTVFGAYDGGTYAGLERVADHLPAVPPHQPRQRLWRFVARRAILCAGATERPVAFADNDRPGVMLASAVRTYVNRFAALPGRSTIVFTCNDDGWRTAGDLIAAGGAVEAILDTRGAEDIAHLRDIAGDAPVFTRARPIGTAGHKGLSAVTFLNANDRPVTLSADCLAISGGWNPNVHLTCHRRGRPVWNDRIAAFVPGSDAPPGMVVAGAAAGAFSTHGALAQGTERALEVLGDLGSKQPASGIPDAEDAPYAIQPVWHITQSKGRAWLDLQNDVTVKDVEVSHAEGFRSVEHMKRYTTLGMATDQGKTASVPAIAVMANLTGRSIAETGTTIFRPPYTPVAIAAFAGGLRGRAFRPIRLTPAHDWSKEQGAVFTEAGLWLRPQWYPRRGEKSWRESVDREVRQTRRSVGVNDVSTLGKIDVKGADAAAFLDRLYTNTMSTLTVGKVRYGLMLREDGFVLDDGTVARLGDSHYLVTTTTANAGLVMQHVDYCHQVHWPELDVHMVSVSDQYAQFAIAGPNARKVLRKLVDARFDIANEAFPYMACGEITVCGGVAARLFRISFSGELAYEVAVPARHGDAMIRAIMEAGREFDIVPYGLEALNVMRIEKGHPVGSELNGQTTAGDLGLARMISAKKDCIGKVMAGRPALTDADRMTLAGFKPVAEGEELTAGAHFVGIGREAKTAHDEGYMTSVCFSPSLGHFIGLGFIRRGHQRHGDKVRAVDAVRGRDIEVEICSPHFVDPQGERLRG
ncbi:MAG: sarcosine oxidase subunit alpha [Alphaproteobacteria bacterium]|nr:MAG: sarcosine oxidase subunit alpha [Alphaproteobacteria bacterium]